LQTARNAPVSKKWAYEKRKGLRRALGYHASIVHTEDGSHLADCVVVDLSEAGARLQVKPEIDVPKRFILMLARVAKVLRRCEIVWRRGPEMGVHFLAAPPRKKKVPQDK
jgi:hypothetical protein